MLKNVAIPLMLAATEAEAQRSMKERIMDMMEDDRDVKFKGLQADAEACTVASSQAADGIADKATTLSDAKA
jgi:hypothetical protein